MSEFTAEVRTGATAGDGCKIAKIIDELRISEPAFAETLEVALAETTLVTLQSIELVMARHGKHAGLETIRKHRNGVCKCQRT